MLRKCLTTTINFETPSLFHTTHIEGGSKRNDLIGESIALDD